MAIRRTREFLDGSRVRYVVISHSPAFSAQEVAASVHLPGKGMAKTVVVNIDGELALAVVPANRGIDLEMLRRAAGASHVDLADEEDFIDRFEGCQLGAMPPLWRLSIP